MNNSKFKIKNSKFSSAFTIVELLVAMTLVIVLMGLSSVIFATAVKAHRMADSSLEITRRAGVIADQLRRDVSALRKDMPLAIWFEYQDTTGDDDPDTRFDQLLFFANGDFQTIKQYDGKTVWGNIARLYYGAANSSPGAGDYQTFNRLSRRAHLLTADNAVSRWPISIDFATDQTNGFNHFRNNFTPPNNNDYEYDTLSLSEWLNIFSYVDASSTPVNAEHIIDNTMMLPEARPIIGPGTYHLLLSEGVSDFRVQLPFFDAATQHYRWWPDDDINDDDNPVEYAFGLYYNMPDDVAGDWTLDVELPRALKFTFTVYDGKGLYPNGRTFTQIVTMD